MLLQLTIDVTVALVQRPGKRAPEHSPFRTRRINDMVNIGDFFQGHVVPELQDPNQVRMRGSQSCFRAQWSKAEEHVEERLKLKDQSI